jgi:hypothetical protein
LTRAGSAWGTRPTLASPESYLSDNSGDEAERVSQKEPYDGYWRREVRGGEGPKFPATPSVRNMRKLPINVKGYRPKIKKKRLIFSTSRL